MGGGDDEDEDEDEEADAPGEGDGSRDVAGRGFVRVSPGVDGPDRAQSRRARDGFPAARSGDDARESRRKPPRWWVRGA